MALIMIDDALPCSLTAATNIASLQAAAFASYYPGAMLRESLTSMIIRAPPGLYHPSECRPGAETPELIAVAKHQDSEVSTQELPSIGSLGHGSGICKPCGFMHHKRGCAAGLGCSFCHLCPAGTIESQRRSKRKVVRAARQSNTGSDILSPPVIDVSPCESPRPSEHDAASQCSTTDSQSMLADTPHLVVLKPALKIDMPSKGSLDCCSKPCQGPCTTNMPMPSLLTSVDRRLKHRQGADMYAKVSCTDAAAAAAAAASAAKVAAAVVVAMRKR